jgi:hypothetical protein
MWTIMGTAPVTEAFAGIDEPCELDATQDEPEDEDEDEDEEYDDDEIEPEGMPHE